MVVLDGFPGPPVVSGRHDPHARLGVRPFDAGTRAARRPEPDGMERRGDHEIAIAMS